jgi:succinyl-diaminopimelate desuccinylase
MVAERAAGERVRQALDVDALVAACQRLVRVPSLSGEEAAVAEVFADLLRRLGYDRVAVDDKSNVIARIEGRGDGPSLMVNGHLDHVPPGDMRDPYAAALVDGSRWGEPGQAIYGRGTCDMKCNLAAAAFAGAALLRAGLRPAGDVILVADVGEELDSPDGVAHVIESGVTADYGLSCESTGLRVYLGHRGKVEFELAVHGRTSHASNPAAGVNAITRAIPLLAGLDAMGVGLANDPILGQGTIAAIDITASPGGGVAVVPDRCTVRVDRRFAPSDTPESCRTELELLVDRLRRDDPSFACDVTQVNLYPLLWIEPDHPLVRATQAARAAVLGEPGELGAGLFGVNGTFMSRAGIPTVGFGPGNERWAHTPQEHVPVADLVTAAEVYAELMLGLGGGDATEA